MTTPTPPAEADLTRAARGDLTVAPVLTTGVDTRVAVGGVGAGETVQAWFFSTPTAAGAHVVQADGSIRVEAPDSLAPGTHRLVVTNTAGLVIGWTAVTVSSPAGLAATGLDLAPIIGGAVLLLVIGGGLLLIRRVRSK